MRPPHRPKRSLGQNFLRDPAIVERIVAALDVSADDDVIEIGPGQGALAECVLVAGARVTAIEFDRDLAPALRERLASSDRLNVIEADALDIDLAAIVPGSAKLVANLPYNISTPILQRLIDQRAVFSRLVLMFQREVVERISAPPGGKERGYLSVIAENAFDIEYLFDVPPQAFFPVPKVWSSVVRLTPKPKAVDEGELTRLVSEAFRHKRKNLRNNLQDVPADVFAEASIDPTRRAETLSLEEWRSLYDAIKKGREL